MGAALAGIKTEWSCKFEKYQTKVIKKKNLEMDTRYMEILEHLKTHHLLTSSAVDSLAKTSALLEKAQELRAAGLDYGDICTELSEMSDPIMSLSKIVLNLEDEDSSTSYMDFPKSGMMCNGNVYKVASLECNNVGSEYIYISAYPDSKFGEGEFPKSVFRQPHLPWKIGGVYPGWRDRRSISEPRTFRSTDGFPNIVDRNKCVGNAVQPLMAQYLFERIKVLRPMKKVNSSHRGPTRIGRLHRSKERRGQHTT